MERSRKQKIYRAKMNTARMKFRREELGLTQKQVAEALGTNTHTYWTWERGLARPHRDDIVELEKILDVEAGGLID